MYDADGKEILSPAAQIDDAEYLRRCALELTANEMPAPPRPPAPRANYVTYKALGRTLEKIGRLVGQVVRESTEPLERKIAELEQGQVHMAGTYKAGQRYRQNGLVSFQGGLWLCLADTDTRPGGGSPAWRLAVKKGSAA